MYIGNDILRQSEIVASKLQQRIAIIKVCHLKTFARSSEI